MKQNNEPDLAPSLPLLRPCPCWPMPAPQACADSCLGSLPLSQTLEFSLDGTPLYRIGFLHKTHTQKKKEEKVVSYDSQKKKD